MPNNIDNDVISLDLDDYKLKFASGTSFFSFEGGSISETFDQQDGFWADLREEGYRLIGKKLFTFEKVKRKEILTSVSPRLHMQLSLPERPWSGESYVVLILDNEREISLTALVDWAIATPFSTTSYFSRSSTAAIYFEIPLMPLIKFSNSNDQFDSLDKTDQWSENQKLIFGIFSFRNDCRYFKKYPFFMPYQLYPDFLINDEIRACINEYIVKADRYIKKESNNKDKETLQWIGTDGTLCDRDSVQGIKGKALLLCHGTFSSTKSAFKGILEDSEFLKSLYRSKYNDILAWDHYTLSKKPAENANELLERLGMQENVTLDIICHSRGAVVVRNLLENPQNQRKLVDKGITINKVIFVAGACQGTQLANSRNTSGIFRRLNFLTWFFGNSVGSFTRAFLIIIKLLTVGFQKIPGIEAMDPAGQEIAKLNSYANTSAMEYWYIRANYENKNCITRYLERFLWDSGVFEGAANDLIVPFEGASPNKKYLKNCCSKMQDEECLRHGTESEAQRRVHHINFFDQEDIRGHLKNLLQ